MKTIKISGKDYKFEYTIEASLYPPCTETIMDTFINIGVGQGAAENNDAMTVVDTIKKTVSNVPVKAMTLFHAGLLEHYEFSEEESKALLRAYLKESGKSFRDILGELMDIVAEDNFFDLIGLNQMFPTEEQTEKKSKKSTKKNEEVGENMSLIP